MSQDGVVPLDDWEVVKIDGFMSLVGPLLRPLDRTERGCFGIQTNEMHGNQIGLIHGGVLTALLDQVMAIRSWIAVDRQPTVSVQMDTKFISSARPGAFLECRAHIRHTTRSLVFVDGEIVSAHSLIATASAVMKILPKQD